MRRSKSRKSQDSVLSRPTAPKMKAEPKRRPTPSTIVTPEASVSNAGKKRGRGRIPESERAKIVKEDLTCRLCGHGYGSTRGLSLHYTERRCPVYERVIRSENNRCVFCKDPIENFPDRKAIIQHGDQCEPIRTLVRDYGRVLEKDIGEF